MLGRTFLAANTPPLQTHPALPYVIPKLFESQSTVNHNLSITCLTTYVPKNVLQFAIKVQNKTATFHHTPLFRISTSIARKEVRRKKFIYPSATITTKIASTA